MIRPKHLNWPHWAIRSSRNFGLIFITHRNSKIWHANLPIGWQKPNRNWSISRDPFKKNSPNMPQSVNLPAKPWVDLHDPFYGSHRIHNHINALVSDGWGWYRSGPVRWHLGKILQWTNCDRYPSLQLLHQVSIDRKIRNKWLVVIFR